jgi:hypothetical protein
MEPAEQHAAVDVGAPAFAVLIDVVGFAVGGDSLTRREGAASVANREHKALPRRVKPLLAPKIEGISVRIDDHIDRPLGAQRAVDHVAGQCVAAVLCVTDREEPPERVSRADEVLHHDHAHSRLASAEHLGCRGEGAGAQDIHQQVVLQLIVRTWVVDDVGCRCAFVVGDEPRSAATRPERGIDKSARPESHFVVEVDAAPVPPVGVDP